MLNNIAVFGPSHVGKSTLIGYIITNDMQPNELENEIEKTRKKIRSDAYDKSRAYGYFVDRALSEIYRDKANDFSTTKQIHIFEFVHKNESIILVDTPGFNKKHEEQFKGLFLAELGIYMIDAKKIAELIDLRNEPVNSGKFRYLVNMYLSPIFLWGQTRKYEDLVFVISKVDAFGFSITKDFIRNVENFLKEMFEVDRIAVTYIWIDIDNRKGYNIFAGNVENLINTPCLMEIIEEKRSRKCGSVFNLKEKITLLETSCFAVIDRKFGQTKSNNQAAFRFKVLSGSIAKGDKVRLGPFKRISTSKRDNADYYFSTATVKSIMLDGNKSLRDTLNLGEIGGLIFKAITTDSETIDSKDIKITETTMVSNLDLELQSGNLINLTLHMDDWNDNWLNNYDFYDLRLNHQIDFHWAGRVITGNLVGKRIVGSDCFIQVFLKDNLFCIPRDMDVLPKKNEISIIKRYARDKFKQSEFSDYEDYKPVVYLKSFIESIHLVSDNCRVDFHLRKITDGTDIGEHIKELYNFNLKKDSGNSYSGQFETNASSIISDIIKLSDVYKDNHGLYDTSEIDVVISIV